MIRMSVSNRIEQPSATAPRTSPGIDRIIVWIATAITLLAHLWFAGRYDLMRNELYFLVCGWHPAFGYADQPALVPLLAAATQMFGHSVWLFRLPAVIATAVLVPLTVAFARLAGGNRLAIILAAIAAAAAPALAGIGTTLTTETFEPLAWTLSAYLIARAVLRDERRTMLWAGLVIGIAMEAKYGIVMWLVPMALGVALTPARRILTWRETWIGAGIAVVIAAPGLTWQAAHGWPFLEIIHNHSADDINPGPIGFMIRQALALNPVLAPLWIAGLVAPFISARLKPLRFLVVAFVGALALNLLTNGKDYYLFAAYPTLFAIGAVVCARIWVWVAGLWMALAVGNFLLVAPILFPMLPPQRLFALLEHSHLRPRPDEKAAIGAPLTQIFSDELGWENLAETTAAVYQSLPPADRAAAAVFGNNYGEAAAIDVYGRALGLPPAISGDNQYFLWGPRGHDGRVVVVINGDEGWWRAHCQSLTIAATFGTPLAMPYERDRPIFVCRNLRGGLAQAWPSLKSFGA
jgi:4-amino-4-deoxy-L-arabinose transferase-like glycosyltransferase